MRPRARSAIGRRPRRGAQRPPDDRRRLSRGSGPVHRCRRSRGYGGIDQEAPIGRTLTRAASGVGALTFLIVGCTGTSSTTTTTAAPTTTTATTAAATTTTLGPPPGQATSVEVTTGGGSEELSVTWDGVTGAATYELTYSENAGGPYASLASVGAPETSDIDAPRPEAAVKPGNCYQVTAVDAAGQQGPPSDEACFQPSFFPNEAGGVHGAMQWGVYLATNDDPDYATRSTTAIERLTHDLGYSQFAFGVELSCDDDAAGALGKDPSTIAVAIYFETESDAEAFATAYYYGYGDMAVGIVEVETGCLD